jgi:hypothetical protein
MLEYLSISNRQPEFPDYLDFQKLREIGINHLQTLSGKLWTDYNLHDPGVTILEVLCYAVTDLGYRNHLEIEDLLAWNPAKRDRTENNFFTVDEILTCNPVTELDIRQRLIDIPGVRNAWLKKVTTYEPAIYIDYARSRLQSTPPDGQSAENAPRLHPRGLYTVYVDLDLGYRKNACGQLYRSWSDTLNEVKAVLCNYRNLCEDVHDVVVLGDEEIAICCDIELQSDANAEDVLVNIYTKLDVLISPRLRFYTLQELLDKGKSIEEIFAGRPATLGKDGYKSHGFIDLDELAALTPPSIIYTSDLYQEILKVPGVGAIKHLSITNYINGLPQSQHPWYLHLTEGYSPVLGVEYSQVTLFKGVLPIATDVNEVKRRYYEQQTAYIKAVREDDELNLSVPQGSYEQLADHYSIQHDFPLTYGLSEEGLPDTATALRKAQARQLQGYLVFFDQVLANYLAQLANVRDLFSWEFDQAEDTLTQDKTPATLKRHTYFIQELDFPGQGAILGENYLDFLQEDLDTQTYRDRRNRFLDHLLGRFAESFSDYVLLNYRMIQGHSDRDQHETEIIHNKAHFLQNYPALSRDRFRAFDYCKYNQVWDTENVSGFQKRVSRLLGIEDVRRRNLCHYRVEPEPSRFTFAVSYGTQELTSQQTYADQNQAQAALDQFLLFALHENFYQRLTYSYFYHYGWEVEFVDAGTSIIARYANYFLSQQARWDWLANLPDMSHAVINTGVKQRNSYYFQLEIPANSADTATTIKFTGIDSYSSPEAAATAANILKQNLSQQNFRPILWRQDQTAERQTATPSDETRFPHYGYALIDNQGKVLAESCDRLPTEEAREIDLQRWLSHIQLNHNQFKFTVEKVNEGYFFTLQHNTDHQILLRSWKYDATELLAWQAATTLAENLRYLNRYVSPCKDPVGNSYSLGIIDQSGNLLAISPTPADAFVTFKRLNSLEPFLVLAAATAQTSGYRFSLLDSSGATLLQGTQLFADQNTASDRFYRDLLGILDSAAILPTQTTDGFSFRVLNRPREQKSEVAIHPQTYATAAERDAAINRLFFLIRTARFTTNITSLAPAYVGYLEGEDGEKILQSQPDQTTQEKAWEQGNLLVEKAQQQDNFRLIDGDNGLYGWELTNEGKELTFATQYYASKSQREQAITTIQSRINDEGFHLLEHILLLPPQKLPVSTPGNPPNAEFLPIFVTPDDASNQGDELCRLTSTDPYSFWISVILPYWPKRFRDMDFRSFIERTLRLEAPAHIAIKIAWVNLEQMRELETAYHDWLWELNPENCDRTGAINRLLTILSQMQSVYPQGILYDAQTSSPENQPIILNQTALGRVNDSGYEHHY